MKTISYIKKITITSFILLVLAQFAVALGFAQTVVVEYAPLHHTAKEDVAFAKRSPMAQEYLKMVQLHQAGKFTPDTLRNALIYRSKIDGQLKRLATFTISVDEIKQSTIVALPEPSANGLDTATIAPRNSFDSTSFATAIATDRIERITIDSTECDKFLASSAKEDQEIDSILASTASFKEKQKKIKEATDRHSKRFMRASYVKRRNKGSLSALPYDMKHSMCNEGLMNSGYTAFYILGGWIIDLPLAPINAVRYLRYKIATQRMKKATYDRLQKNARTAAN